MHQTVLHELHAGYFFGVSLYVLFLHVNLVFFHQLVFRQMPFEFFQHLVEVFLQLLSRHLFVGLEYPAFEEINRELNLLHLLHDSLFGIQTEFVFTVLGHVGFDLCLHACAELFLVFRSVLAINFGEQFLVECSSCVAGDLLDLECEIACQTGSLLFGDAQHRTNFYFAAVCFGRVESYYIAFLGADEFLLLGFLLHVSGVEDSAFFDDLAVHLLGNTFHDVAFSDLLCLAVLAETLAVGLNLVVHHLVGYFDDIFG